ncbi:MAG: hypothetical protein HY298_10675 [Verrucomicrobia bacterium]|nr:hypothetical protein [Verrucomicrobiota bacterium]
MKKLTTDATREIISDLAKEIKRRAHLGPKPTKTVIDFRTDRASGRERDVYFVPVELLLYRKDNGRIASDVVSHERNHGKIVEASEGGQAILRKFLEDKDREKTEELKRSIAHDDQREAAIITCDGFLINGNRRKMVFEMLKLEKMKVVILPGEDDTGEGGSPTLKEIEQIENRYQLQSDGKAEYYAFDRALSMQRKIRCGMSLEEQLKDDPQYAHLEKRDFDRAVEKAKTEYLGPLECIDRYLDKLNREKLYSTVSTGLGDPEGRWQAFLDYYQFVYKKLKDANERLKLKLREDEVGKVEDVAFKLIRKRDFSKISAKVHKLMRDLPDMLENADAKRELFKINQISLDLPKEKRLDANGNEHDERTVDKLWGGETEQQILRHLATARTLQTQKSELETPLHLLEVALAKLTHKDMDASAVNALEYERAMKLTQEIQREANSLEHEFFKLKKERDKLKTKK